MKEKIVTLLLVVLIAGLMSFVVMASQAKEKTTREQKLAQLTQGEPIFYYGVTCPHCKDVEAWFVANQVEEKMAFAKKEVWNNQANANELNVVAASCGLDLSNIGVPFLYAEGKCLIGSPDIISYFSERLDLPAVVDQATNSAVNKEDADAISN